MSNVYEILRLRSIEDLRAAETLMKSEHYDHAIEQCHFSLEKIMKAALFKNGARRSRIRLSGHNLIRIANIKVNGRKILHNTIKSNSTMIKFWERVQGSWDTNLRYHFMSLAPSDYDDLFEAYRGLSGWIRIKLVK